MASSLQRPQAIKEPFANSGDKNTIPVADTGTQRASLDEGFPQITEIPVSEGGIPPERKDMNALGYLTTSQYFYLQCGGRFTFDPDVSTAIGGYPAGAVLEYTDTNTGLSYAVISVINNNTYNFVATPSYIDGSKWKKAFSEDLSNYVDRSTNQSIAGQKTFSSSPIVPTPATSDDSQKAANTAFVKAQGYALNRDVVNLTENQTVDGIKKLKKGLYVYRTGNEAAIHQNVDIVKGTAPNFNILSRWRLCTSGGVTNAYSIAGLELSYNTNGNVKSMLQAFKPEANSTTSAAMGIIYPSSGDPYTEAPTPASTDNSTQIATTAFVKSVLSTSGNGLTTYSQGENGYYKFTNGLLIQWGQTASGSSTTVTFPTAFTSTNYVVSVGFETASGENYAAGYDTKTTTGFKIHTNGGAASRSKSWIAIGY